MLRDTEAREIDYHTIITDERGKFVAGNAYPAESLTASGAIAGHRVECISAEFVGEFHTGYAPNETEYLTRMRPISGGHRPLALPSRFRS